MTPAIFFSLLIIAVAFLPVFTLTGQAGRLFKPLAYTKTFVMLISALLSITFAPALRDLLIRGKIRPENEAPGLALPRSALYEPFVYVALRRPKSTVAIGLFALASAVPLALRLGNEFMPPLNEGDLLYMPITFPNISIEEAKRQLQYQDRILRSFPEVETVFGKVGRAESADRSRRRSRWSRPRCSSSPHERVAQEAPRPLVLGLGARLARSRVCGPLWPEEQPLTWDELTTEMNGKMQFPGWTNAWTMPIKTRVDMLTTGVRTPIGIKVFGTDLNEVEQVGVALEHVLAPIKGTRSVLYERNLGGLYLDIIPKPDELARYGLRVADVERVIESAIGGDADRHDDRGAQPLLDQRALPAGPAQRPRIAAPGAGLRRRRQPAVRPAGGGGMPMGTQGALEAPRPRDDVRVRGRASAGRTRSSSRRTWRGWAAAPRRSAASGTPRPRLPSGPSVRDRTCRPTGRWRA